jgi:glycogen operon protein
MRFTQRVIALRGALPMLRRGRFLSGIRDDELGVKDVAWLTPAGDEMTEQHWPDGNARCMGVLLDGRAQETGIRRIGTDATLLLVLNAHHDVVEFTLPTGAGGCEWVRLVDTQHVNEEDVPPLPFGHKYEVTGQSLILFMLRPEHGPETSDSTARSFEHVVGIVRSFGTSSRRTVERAKAQQRLSRPRKSAK